MFCISKKHCARTMCVVYGQGGIVVCRRNLKAVCCIGYEGNAALKLQVSRRSSDDVKMTRTTDGAGFSGTPGMFPQGGFGDSGRLDGTWQEGGMEAEEQSASFWFGSSSDSDGELSHWVDLYSAIAVIRFALLWFCCLFTLQDFETLIIDTGSNFLPLIFYLEGWRWGGGPGTW